MKKTTKKEEQEKEKRSIKFLLYAIIILAVVIISILSIRFFYTPKEDIQSYTYNNFLFVNESGLWVTEIQKAGTNKVFRVSLHYGPLEMQDIEIEDEFNSFK